MQLDQQSFCTKNGDGMRRHIGLYPIHNNLHQERKETIHLFEQVERKELSIQAAIEILDLYTDDRVDELFDSVFFQ